MTDWKTRNAGPGAVAMVRARLLVYGAQTEAELMAWTTLSKSAVQAARAQLDCVPAGKGERNGTCGRFPTLWALPKEKKR